MTLHPTDRCVLSGQGTVDPKPLNRLFSWHRIFPERHLYRSFGDLCVHMRTYFRQMNTNRAYSTLPGTYQILPYVSEVQVDSGRLRTQAAHASNYF
jgi:hypothetical protein